MIVTRETSRVEISIYTNHKSEFGASRPLQLDFKSTPKNEITDEHVISVSTVKRMGEPAGSFEVQIKSPRDLRRLLQDGDWIDIVFTRHDTSFHVMRGIILTISQSLTAASGATEATYTLIGNEFSYIFATQGFWFDQITQGDFFPWASNRIWGLSNEFANGPPNLTVWTLLTAYLQPANNDGAALWQLPSAMPLNLARNPEAITPMNPRADPEGKNMFRDAIRFVDGYSHIPPRTSMIIPSRFNASASSIWELATEFADTMLCELYCDLITISETPRQGRVSESL